MVQGSTRRIAIGAALALLILGACGEGGGSGGAQPTTTDAADRPGEPSTTTQTGEVISIEVRDGEVVNGAGRVDVDLGESVRLVVVSDVDGEVHVHGYDLLEPVEAGGTAEISFVAGIPGVFEVEMEGTHLLLLELAVS